MAPANPVDDFENGAPVGCNKGSTGEDFRPVNLVGKGDELSNIVDCSLRSKNVEWPPLFRGNAESDFKRDVGVSVFAFTHLKPTATAWPAGEIGRHPR